MTREQQIEEAKELYDKCQNYSEVGRVLGKSAETIRLWLNPELAQKKKQYYENNKERIKEYYLNNKEKYRQNHKKWSICNREQRKQYCKQYSEDNIEQRKKYCKQYQKDNKDHIKQYHKKYEQINKKRIKLYKKDRYRNDVEYRIKEVLRARLYSALKNQKTSKQKPAKELVGCSVTELKQHLESQFQEGMTWNNHGDWHIDHIKPCASFDLTKEEEQKNCFHYTNLQPLWAEENLKKGDSL